jgi:hypothetical protein
MVVIGMAELLGVLRVQGLSARASPSLPQVFPVSGGTPAQWLQAQAKETP